MWITDAEKAKGTYEILIKFNDGKSTIVDLKSTIENDHRPIIRDLLDVNTFNSFTVANDTVSWKNGVDFAPEYLYEIGNLNNL
jgi:transposase-like protein